MRLKLGFTFVELIIVLSITATIASFSYLLLNNFQRSADLTATMTQFVSDFKSQQLKSMLGSTEGRASKDTYGVAILASSYVLFHGATYNSSDTTNLVIALPSSLQFTLTGATQIVFANGGGEVVAYNAAKNSITLKNITGNSQKIATFNKYGTIISVL